MADERKLNGSPSINKDYYYYYYYYYYYFVDNLGETVKPILRNSGL